MNNQWNWKFNEQTYNKIYDILKWILKYDVSDIHFVQWNPVYIRNNVWKIIALEKLIIDEKQIRWFAHDLTTAEEIDLILQWQEIDTSFYLDWIFFRVNIYMDKHWIRAALRKILAKIPTLEELWLHESMKHFLMKNRWLILVTWPTWSWKSTTLASMIDFINKNRNVHVITIEDPIEYVFENNKALITQRQIWKTCKTFTSAMKYVLRQDPDVIMVWEMRDLDSIASVLTLVETWHLVLSTLHTIDSAQTITRIIDAFPPDKQDQIAIQLSLSLELVISQRLFPHKNWKWRAVCREIMINTNSVANNIRQRKIPYIRSIIETWWKYWMNTMDNSIAQAVIDWQIDLESAKPNVKDLENFYNLIKTLNYEKEKKFNPID